MTSLHTPFVFSWDRLLQLNSTFKRKKVSSWWVTSNPSSTSGSLSLSDFYCFCEPIVFIINNNTNYFFDSAIVEESDNNELEILTHNIRGLVPSKCVKRVKHKKDRKKEREKAFYIY